MALKAKKKPGKSGTGERTKNASLTEQAYEAIKEKIITLFFVPGQYLNEGAICDLLGLGRTPVHQALQRLQIDGLVDIVPRKGVVIQPDSISQILEILEARMAVETDIARRAALNATEAGLAELQHILDQHSQAMTGGAAHGGGAIDSFVECDRAFHGKIIEMAKSKILGDFARSLHERSTRSWYLHLWQTLDVTASDRQHRAVLKALRAGDGEAAADAMRSHLTSLRERVAHLQSQAPRRHAAQPA